MYVFAVQERQENETTYSTTSGMSGGDPSGINFKDFEKGDWITENKENCTDNSSRLSFFLLKGNNKVQVKLFLGHCLQGKIRILFFV